MSAVSAQALHTTLTGKIDGVRRRELRRHLVTGAVNAAAGLTALVTVVGLLEYLFLFGTTGRAILFYGGAAVAAAILLRSLFHPLGRMLGLLPAQNDETIARRVGAAIPAVGDRLVNTLQLYGTAEGRGAGVSSDLAAASILSVGPRLLDHDYDVIIGEQERRRSLLLLLSAALTLGGLFMLLGGDLADAYGRVRDHGTHYQRPAPFTLAVAPGDVQAVRGDSVDIVIRASGIPPRSVTLHLRGEGSDRTEAIELEEREPGVYRHRIADVRDDIRYRAEAGIVATPTHTISVVEHPEIVDVTVTVTPPGYTGRRAERLPEGRGDVGGLRGTRVAVTATTTMPAARAEIVQLFAKSTGGALLPVGSIASPAYDTVRIPMTVSGRTISGGFTLRRDGEYYLSITSADGLRNPAPVRYTMSVSTDGGPSIALLQPLGDTDVDPSLLVPTQVRISDDYGFSRLRIMYKLVGSSGGEPWRAPRAHAIPLPRRSSLSLEVPYLWNMAPIAPVAGDEYEIYFEVTDNDVVTGPKSARTGTVRLRFLSNEEIIRAAETIESGATADLQELLRRAEQARRDMQGLDRELAKQLAQKRSEADWQANRKIEELIARHEAMQKDLEKVADDLRTMAEKMRQAEAISPETLKKYEDLQKLFEQVEDPELKRSMERIQEEMGKMTPEEMAEAMKNYEFNEKEFRESIERTAKMLERMKMEKEADRLARRAEQLATKQEQLNADMETADPSDVEEREGLAERQKRLAEQTERLQQDARDLAAAMKEQEGTPSERMESAAQSLQQSDPAGAMRQAEQSANEGEMGEARSEGEKAEESLEEFSESMDRMREQMGKKGEQQAMNKMRKSLKDLLELSKRQEELREKTEEAGRNSPSLRELAREQQQLGESLENVANDMMDAGEQSTAVTPEMARTMGDAMQQMEGAQESMEKQDGGSAAGQQGKAMSSMNQAAKMLAEAMSQMQSPDGSGGEGQEGSSSSRQRLQQLAAQQQMINMAMGRRSGQQQAGGQQGGQQGQQGQQGEQSGGQQSGGQQSGGSQSGGSEGEGGEGGGSGSQGGNGGENGGDDGMAGRLTRQQQEVKKSLDELNREAREAGGTRKNTVGDLERAARDIEEVLRDMQAGRITEETQERQDRILSRMLDALKSPSERDYDRERESRPGADIVRTSPSGISLDGEAARREIDAAPLREGRQGYSDDYEYLIRKYFESIGR